jgi:hypothetical protein
MANKYIDDITEDFDIKFEKSEPIDKELVSKPYPNEHAARVESPDKYDKFARNNGKFGSGIDAIFGIKDGKSELQAVRFDKTKFTVDEAKKWLKDNDIKYISFEPAEKVSKEWNVELIKTNEERFVLGVVLQPDIEDLQGDVISSDEIAKASHNFMESCQTIGLEHKEILPSVRIWESYIAPQDLTFSKEKVVKGSWLLGVHVTDDEVWKAIKDNSITGFSVHGVGAREKVS